MSEPIEPIELDDESHNPEQSQDDGIKKEEPQPQVKGSVKYGEDAFSHVKPLSIVAFNITTPTGKVLKCRSQYVGLHSKHLIVLETPDVTPQEYNVFFQRGFSIKACAINSQGEGARIYFKSKIEYVVETGDISLCVITLPRAVQVIPGMRSEARLELQLDGILEPETKKYLCEVRDISNSGCQIVLDKTISGFKVGNVISLLIQDMENNGESTTVHGVIRNTKTTANFRKFGVQFDTECVGKIDALVERLSYCHSTQRFLL